MISITKRQLRRIIREQVKKSREYAIYTRDGAIIGVDGNGKLADTSPTKSGPDYYGRVMRDEAGGHYTVQSNSSLLRTLAGADPIYAPARQSARDVAALRGLEV